MPMPAKSNPWLRVDTLILVTGLLTLLTAVYAFINDDNVHHFDQGNVASIGKVSSARGDVRRRTQTGYFWSSSTPGELFLEGDSVYAGLSSEATIAFAGGATVALEPYTLATFTVINSKLYVDLQQGSLTGIVTANQPILVSQDGELREITPQRGMKSAEIRLEEQASTAGDGLREILVRTVHGEIRVRGQEVKETEVAVLKRGATPMVQKESFDRLLPANGATVWVAPGSLIDFSWKAPDEITRTRIEFSNDPRFFKLAFQTEVAGSIYQLGSENIPSGRMYWRLVPLAGGVETSHDSQVNALSVFPDTPPLPVFPADQQEFAFNREAKENGKQILLTWEDRSGSAEFELQITRDANFSQLLTTKKLQAMSERTDPLVAGDYYWRVKGLHPARSNSPWSVNMRFSVSGESSGLPAPTLAANFIQYRIPAALLNPLPVGAEFYGRGIVPEGITPFSWNEVPEAEGYEVEISNQASFANSLKHQVGRDLKIALKEVKPGAIFLRVRAFGKKGLVSPPSETARFDVSIEPPRLEPLKLTGDGENQTILLKWSPRPFAAMYEIHWGPDPEFTTSKKLRLKETEKVVSVARAGFYAARVRALGADGEGLSPYSPPQTFDNELHEKTPLRKQADKKVRKRETRERQPTSVANGALEAPRLLGPQPTTPFVSLNDAPPFVNLIWEKVKDAATYEIQLAEDADFTKVVGRFKSTSPSHRIRANLPEGRIFWRVRALGRRAPSEWSKTYDLNILYQ